MNAYQHTIHQIDKSINPAGIEASMRMQHDTLDHLPYEAFAQEVEIAKALEADYPGHLRELAASYGLEQDYDEWEGRIQQPNRATET